MTVEHYKHLTDAQKMKLISYVGGYDTRLVGGEWASGAMSYRIVPQKPQLFITTAGKEGDVLSTIGYVLNYIAFIHDAIKETYPADKNLTNSEQSDKRWWEHQLTLPLESRQDNNLTPAFITHVSEDITLVSDTASGAIDLFFKKLLTGSIFISFNVKAEQATVARWEDNCIISSFYSLQQEWRNKSESWKHMKKGGDFRCTITNLAA